jgi:hypothetical protein
MTDHQNTCYSHPEAQSLRSEQRNGKKKAIAIQSDSQDVAGDEATIVV